MIFSQSKGTFGTISDLNFVYFLSSCYQMRFFQKYPKIDGLQLGLWRLLRRPKPLGGFSEKAPWKEGGNNRGNKKRVRGGNVKGAEIERHGGIWFNGFQEIDVRECSSYETFHPCAVQADADLGMFSMFSWRDRGSTGQRMSESSATFSGQWGLFMACCNAEFTERFRIHWCPTGR